MIPWWFIFILIKSIEIESFDNMCNYIVNKSNSINDICISDECNKFVDPYSIMVQPNDCKTKILYLAFSSYKNFSLFLHRMKWKLGDLFPLRLNNDIRRLRIYIDQIDYNDQPVDHSELIRLGINIDLYELYIKYIPNKDSFYGSIHYDPIDPEWYIIKVQFVCNSLMIYDGNSCSSHIIPPPFFAPQRPSSTTITTTSIFTTNQISFSNEPQDQKSIHLVIIILIPLLIILITIIIAIVVYKYIAGKRCSQIDLTATPRSLSIPSISNNIESKSGEYSQYRANAKPYQVSRLPSPHKDSLYKEPQRHSLKRFN